MVGAALKAESLVLLTAVPGLLRSSPTKATLIKQNADSRRFGASVDYGRRAHEKENPRAQESLQGGVGA